MKVIIDSDMGIRLQHKAGWRSAMPTSVACPYDRPSIAIYDSIVVWLHDKSVWALSMAIGACGPQRLVSLIHDQVAISLHEESELARGEVLPFLQSVATITEQYISKPVHLCQLLHATQACCADMNLGQQELLLKSSS